MADKKLFGGNLVTIPSGTKRVAIGDASTVAENITLDNLRKWITGTTATLQRKAVEIGKWNMDSTRGKDVSTGIALSKIRSIANITIKSDSGELYPFYYPDSSSDWGLSGCVKVCNTPTSNAVINIARNDGKGFFDQSGFNDPNMNRGWIIVDYES